MGPKENKGHRTDMIWRVPPYTFLITTKKKQRSAPGPWEIFVNSSLLIFFYFFFFFYYLYLSFLKLRFSDSLVFSILFLCYLLFFRLFRLLFTVNITACATNISLYVLNIYRI